MSEVSEYQKVMAEEKETKLLEIYCGSNRVIVSNKTQEVPQEMCSFAKEVIKNYDEDDEVNDLRSEMEDLESKNASLESKAEKLQEEKDSLQTKVNSLEEEKASLQSQVKELEDEVESLRGEIS